MDLDEKYFIHNKGQREFAGVLKGFDDFFNMVL
jgi:small nuclear ribonucleoprotein (snRNP)-like protein